MDGDGYEPCGYEPDSYDDARPGPPCDEDTRQRWRKSGMAENWLLSGRAQSADHEAERYFYRAPGDEALAEFIRSLDPDEFADEFAMAMLGALFLRRWLRDHQGLLPPMLRRFFLALLAVLRAIVGEPGRPGDADDPSARVPSAPLVRAHAILTAAPPCSRAPVPAGVAA